MYSELITFDRADIIQRWATELTYQQQAFSKSVDIDEARIESSVGQAFIRQLALIAFWAEGRTDPARIVDTEISFDEQNVRVRITYQ